MLRFLLPAVLAAALLFFATLPAAATPPAPQSQAAATAQRVDRYYNALHSLRCDFTETYQAMGIRRQERGELLLRKSGMMRWSYSAPAGKLFILSGGRGWFYAPGDAQAERMNAAHLDDFRTPLRFLLGHTHLEKEMEDLTVSSVGGVLELSGTPKGMENRIESLALGIDPAGAIESMTIRERDGAMTAFTFSNCQPDAPAPNSEFVFHPPAGIPVVDGLPPV